MSLPAPLPCQQLYQACDPLLFSFQTTAELESLSEVVGQLRAMSAVRFGAGIRQEGYNLFVLGPSGMGKRTLVNQFLKNKSHGEPDPVDWCYINNFTEPHKPQALCLPTGRGADLRRDMERLLADLRSSVPNVFEGKDYRGKLAAIQNEFSKRQDQAFKELGETAAKQGINLQQTQEGFTFSPARKQGDGASEGFENLSEDERQRLIESISALQALLLKILGQVPLWRKERNEKIRQLDRQTMLSTVELLIKELRARYVDLPEVLRYLDIVQQDMVEHGDEFRKQEEGAGTSELAALARANFHRYQVNVLVTNGRKHGSAIVSEDNPSYGNLLGRVEHISQFGALVTDFTLIKPGALHQANGGYLLLDIRKLLMQPFAWEGLKRALQSREIRIESLGQILSLVSTVSLEPEPIPLDVKIVLFGDRLFYYLLAQYDPDFEELFKVVADFEERIERNTDTHQLYARLIATLGRKEDLQACDRGAVARVIEYGARLVDDASRLSTHMRSIADLLREADYWAREAGHPVVDAADVQRAIDTQIHRHDRLRSRLQEEILRGNRMIDTEGAVIGQINALSVIDLGNFAFALPVRITATTHLGDGELINIEREVKLSGAIHSKGVLILSSFLSARYGKDMPLAFSASLVFEQSYGFVEGDSASLAELCVLLSNLAGAPIRQSLAITGSVNQFGQAQAIGGVNEKIEGFFDICNARGLNGEHGVLIPAANIKQLMLRWDVVLAAQAGKFHIYAVNHVDQAIALLTGLSAGEADAHKVWPPGSLNGRVAARLAELSTLRKTFATPVAKKRKRPPSKTDTSPSVKNSSTG
ncbi:Lon protease family protein [Uliginosibacterium flavum]|uniref:endopeptidase La n=1 Tax=Uliginosibacterium flavum TaxID=1396831 RepID=A0ABV2THQ1_9RHOO